MASEAFRYLFILLDMGDRVKLGVKVDDFLGDGHLGQILGLCYRRHAHHYLLLLLSFVIAFQVSLADQLVIVSHGYFRV
jgi:hypothetical protein